MRYDPHLRETLFCLTLHPIQVFFHKYFSRKNRKQRSRTGQDESSEGATSEVSQDFDAVSDEQSEDDVSSDAEEDVVWKVRTSSDFLVP